MSWRFRPEDVPQADVAGVFHSAIQVRPRQQSPQAIGPLTWTILGYSGQPRTLADEREHRSALARDSRFLG